MEEFKNFHSRKAKFNFSRREFSRLEKSLKVLAQTNPDNQVYDFMSIYLKFRISIQKQVQLRETQVCYREGDLSSMLFSFEDPSKAKSINFISMVFGKQLSKNPEMTKNSELKGKVYIQR